MQLWELKTGRRKAFDGNKFTLAGHRLEPVIVQYFEDMTEYEVLDGSEANIHYTHPTHEYLTATPDRRYEAFEDIPFEGILECKSTQKHIDKEEIPLSWFCQNQWQIGICGLDDGAIAWLERGLDFDYMEFNLNGQFFEEMVNKAGEFWHKYVLTDTPPPAVNSDDINRMYDSSKIGKIVQASVEMTNIHNELCELREERKRLDERIDQLSETVKMVMRDAEGVSYYDELLFTWKTAKSSVRFDWRKFQVAYPSLYDEFCNVVPGSRRFLVK